MEEAAGTNGDAGEGSGSTQETALLDFAGRSFAAASPKSVNPDSQSDAANGLSNGPFASTARPMPAKLKSALPAGRIAPSRTASVANVQTSEIAPDSRVNRSDSSDKPDSAMQRTDAATQAPTSTNESLITPIEVITNPIVRAPAAQAQTLVSKLPASTYSVE